jgi:hypothetical protein
MMKAFLRMQFWITLVSTLLTVVGASAAELPTEIETIKSPKYLYHWTTYFALEAIAKTGRWESFETRTTAAFLSLWPEFNNSPKGYLFVHHHPMTAIQDRFRNYGPVLIRIEIDQDKAKAVLLPQSKNGDAYHIPDGTNLLHHQHINEWVALDPSIIKSITADPEVLRPVLEQQLKLLKNSDYSFDEKDIHMSKLSPDPMDDSNKDRLNAIKTVEDLLRNGSRGMPDFFVSPQRRTNKSAEARRGEREVMDFTNALHDKATQRLERIREGNASNLDILQELVYRGSAIENVISPEVVPLFKQLVFSNDSRLSNGSELQNSFSWTAFDSGKINFWRAFSVIVNHPRYEEIGRSFLRNPLTKDRISQEWSNHLTERQLERDQNKILPQTSTKKSVTCKDLFMGL